jgi:hypothetical protein
MPSLQSMHEVITENGSDGEHVETIALGFFVMPSLTCSIY